MGRLWIVEEVEESGGGGCLIIAIIILFIIGTIVNFVKEYWPIILGIIDAIVLIVFIVKAYKKNNED